MNKQIRLVLACICAVLLLPLAGCSSIMGWFSGKAPPRNPPAALVQFTPTKTPQRAWTVKVGSSGDYIFSPAFTYDAIYAAAADGTVVKIDPSTGGEIWRKNVGMNLTAGVASDGSTVVVAGVKGNLIALDSNGQQKWKSSISTESLASPVIAQDIVVVRSMDNKIAGYDIHTGERRWLVPYRAPALMLRSSPGIATIGPTVIVALPGGRILSMMLNNGGVRWEIAVGESRGATELERIADVSGVPAIFGQGVCVAAYQGRMGCFDAISGSAYWVKDFSSKVGVSIDENFVYAVDIADKVYALSNIRGQSVWRNDRMTYRNLTTPISYRSTVAVGDGQGFVHFLSQNDGAFVARIETDGSAIQATPIVVAERLVIQTRAGTLQAIILD